MNVRMSTLVLLLLAIFLEIYVITFVSSRLGGLLTIFLIVFGSVFGYLLIKHQTGSTLSRVQQSLMRGEIPQIQVIEAGVVMFAGILLMIPGFITDVLGLVCVLPPVRRKLAQGILQKMMQKMNSAMNDSFYTQSDVRTDFDYDATSEAEREDPTKNENDQKTIEGDYKRED